MTPDKDLIARLKLHDDGATPGKWGQYHPCFMDDAKDAQPQEWDTSHDVSGVKDGKRWKVAHYKHADDAAFAEVLVNAYRSGQLITLADQARAVQAAVAKAVEAITAERDAVQAELRVALGGCDANGGWNHRPISLPSAAKDIFCQDCGEMLDKATAKRHLSAAANRTPTETPAAIRARKGEAL